MIPRDSHPFRALPSACVVLVLLALCFPASGRADGPMAARGDDAGTPIFGEPLIDHFRLVDEVGGFAGTRIVVAEIVPEGIAEPRGLRVTVSEPPPQFWNVQLLARAAAPLRAGDLLYVTFWARQIARTVEDLDAEDHIVLNVQEIGGSFDVITDLRANPGPEWRQYDHLFRMPRDYEPSEIRLAIPLGITVQTFEIAGLDARVFAEPRYLEDLPTRDISYPGREDDAPWRVEAIERIDRVRKSDLTIRVVDAAGEPIPGATVRARMTRHAFPFGTAINAEYMHAPIDPPATYATDLRMYRERIGSLFTMVVFENAMKWPFWNWWKESFTLQTLDEFRAQGMMVRGHCLIWPGWANLPEDLRSAEGDPAELRRRWREHFADLLDSTAGKIDHWDVLNEPYENNDLIRILGEEEIAEWFRFAREHAPEAVLTINETKVLSWGGAKTTRHDHLERLVRELRAAGAPIDAVAFQAHMEEQVTPPARVLEILDRFAALDLRIHISEFDAQLPHPEFQRAYMRDFMTAVFSHPNVDCFVIWGFWDGMHFLSWAPLYRRDWSLRPMGEEWMRLVFDEWWTRAEGATDGRGEFRTRGFRGDYEIEVEVGGRTVTHAASLGDEPLGVVVAVR